jgi:cell division protein FtsL
MGTLSKEWAISMAFSLALLLVFGLGLVWVNIERVDLAYELNKIQRQIDEMETLSAKLEVERNTLVTPSRLREQAKDHGLGPARPGQIRRVAANGEIEASPMVAVTAEPAKPAAKAPAKPGPAEPAKAAAKPAAVEAPKAAPAPKPFKPAAAGQQ